MGNTRKQIIVEEVLLKDIKPYGKNAKKHPAEQIENTANSIKRFGWKQPLVIDKDRIIVVGHCRYLAAKKLGLKTAPCIMADDLTDEEIKAYRLADNKTNESEWDLDLLDLELKELESLDIDMGDFGFDLSLGDDNPPAVDAVEDGYDCDQDVEPRTKPGELYQLGEHRLIIGDSTDPQTIKRLMGNDTADLLLTDPPYNVDYQGGTGMKIRNDNMEDTEFLGFLKKLFSAADAALKPGGVFNTLGNCEIDPAMNEIYKKNHHPKYSFLMDLRDFNKLEDIPEELLHLDILDGSPPCSTFSLAGGREKNWGKEKAFREGQKKQTLDDLFFVFLDTVGKLKPKVVIAENVKGILQGNAKGYCNLIVKRFKKLGYDVQIFQLNAAYMDVPQARERVFFIANRMGYKKLKISFHEKPILFGDVREEHGKPFANPGCLYARLLEKRKPGDKDLAKISERVRGKYSSFNSKIIWDGMVSQTITANGTFFRGHDGLAFTDRDFVSVGSFPQDYDFCGHPVQYVTGMSVPPNMMANVATEVYKQWFL